MKSIALNTAFAAVLLAAIPATGYAQTSPTDQGYSGRNRAQDATGNVGAGSYAEPKQGKSQSSKSQRARAASGGCQNLAYDSPEYTKCMDNQAKTRTKKGG